MKTFSSRRAEPADWLAVCGALRDVGGVAALPTAACGELFNLPSRRLPDRLRAIGLSPGKTKWLGRSDVEALSRDLKEKPDIATLEIDDERYTRRSRAIPISEIRRGFQVFQAQKT
jgi:hypothetical protein